MPPYISVQGKTLLSFLMKENPKERMQLKDVRIIPFIVLDHKINLF